MAPLRISLWNVNGVSRHKLELAQFMNDNEIDVMLLAPDQQIQFRNPGVYVLQYQSS